MASSELDEQRASRGEHLGDEDLASQAQTRESYERIPYQSHSWTTSQPAHLETLGRLFGADPAPADACRVLEIGCGDGGNLLPLAIAHPGSRFVGVDLAKGHIETARGAADRFGLDNVQLVADSFVDFDSDVAPFDYIIAHGLMSWVTPGLQSMLLATCKRLLAPGGVAFISYNTWPGWAMQASIREILRRHSRGIDDVETLVERSRVLLETLLATVPGKETAYREFLESIAKIAADPSKRYYFAHEYLEDENHPFYVRDFIEAAEAAGLRYLADAELIDRDLDNMPREQAEPLEQLAEDPYHRLQLLDFVMNRRFRQTLLCHADVEVCALPDFAELVPTMHVSTQMAPDVEDPPLADDTLVSFSDRHGRTIEVDQPLVKAALAHLHATSPQPIAFDVLVERAESMLRTSIGGAAAGREAVDDDARRLLALILGRLQLADMVELRASPPCWALEPGERPVASPLARANALRGERTTSLRHRPVALDNPLVCEVLGLLDGSRDRPALYAHFEGRVEPAEIDKILGLAARNAVLLPQPTDRS